MSALSHELESLRRYVAKLGRRVAALEEKDPEPASVGDRPLVEGPRVWVEILDTYPPGKSRSFLCDRCGLGFFVVQAVWEVVDKRPVWLCQSCSKEGTHE